MGTADGNGVIMIADTLYNILPGHLWSSRPSSRAATRGSHSTREGGDNAPGPSKGEPTRLSSCAPISLCATSRTTGNHIAVTTMHDRAKTTAIYRLSDGALLCSKTYPELSKKSSINLMIGGKPVTVDNLLPATAIGTASPTVNLTARPTAPSCRLTSPTDR